jgi:protoporphyrinogen oxidase
MRNETEGSEPTEFLIVGSGIAGLAAAQAARAAGRQAVVLETAARAGGILDSFEIDGFRFDNGVHLSFAKEPAVRAVFDQTPFFEHDALSLCWDRDIWLRHPVQNNLYPLEAEVKARLIESLVHVKAGEIANYRDWLLQQYGAAIAERWPLAYTEKYWTVPAERLGTAWVGPRMRQADLHEVLLGAMTENVPSTYYISKMRYPRQGGYRAFIEPLIKGADIRYGHEVIEVDAGARSLRCANGRHFTYQNLISTMPLPMLVRAMPDIPGELRAMSETLFATEVDLISIAINKPTTLPRLWIYIYDRDLLASRAYAPDLKSPHNVPEGCSAVQFEIYASRERPQRASVAEMTENCLMALERMQLARRDEVRFTHHKRLPHANVVFDLGMEKRRDQVKQWLQQQGIGLAGRFGEWAYLWSNQSMMSGIEAVEQMLTRK